MITAWITVLWPICQYNGSKCSHLCYKISEAGKLCHVPGLEPVRILSCAGAQTSKTPQCVTDYDPSRSQDGSGTAAGSARRRVRVRMSLTCGAITYAAYTRT